MCLACLAWNGRAVYTGHGFLFRCVFGFGTTFGTKMEENRTIFKWRKSYHIQNDFHLPAPKARGTDLPRTDMNILWQVWQITRKVYHPWRDEITTWPPEPDPVNSNDSGESRHSNALDEIVLVLISIIHGSNFHNFRMWRVPLERGYYRLSNDARIIENDRL